MKTCTKCGSTEFYKDGRCKPCRAKNEAAYIARNYEKIQATRKSKREQNREAVLAAKARYREKNRKRLADKQRAYRDLHVQRENERAKAWYLANPDRALENRIEYYKNNKVKYIQRGIVRRSKLRETGKLSVGLERKLLLLQKGKCACCGNKLGDDYHIDHIMPLALGGENVDSNIQLLRAKCNLSKSAKHPVDYMQSKGFLI